MEKIHTQAELNNMSGPALVALFNLHSDKPVKKFADKAAAIKRVYAVLPAEKAAPKAKKPSAKKTEQGGAAEKREAKMAEHRARKIKVLIAENPKRGSAAERFDLYKNGMTVGEYLEAGGQLRDVAWDKKVGFISVG